jgi:hypothetical protein
LEEIKQEARGLMDDAKCLIDSLSDWQKGMTPHGRLYIVVGRRGLSRVEEFFMGRVSDKVLQLAKEMAVWVVT